MGFLAGIAVVLDTWSEWAVATVIKKVASLKKEVALECLNKLQNWASELRPCEKNWLLFTISKYQCKYDLELARMTASLIKDEEIHEIAKSFIIYQGITNLLQNQYE